MIEENLPWKFFEEKVTIPAPGLILYEVCCNITDNDEKTPKRNEPVFINL